MAAPIKIACTWNCCRISSPPVVSCLYGCYEIDEDDVKKLKEVLEVIQTSQSTALHLSSEQYTVSRLLYKVNNQQRRWKYYQMLQKIHKCLIKLQANHPTKFINDAACCCQISRDHDNSRIKIQLPSRQMLEFILTRLMGQAKLCAYILSLAEMVFILVVQSLAGGDFVSHNTIIAAIVSRVWVVMRAMVKDFISWYGDLRPWVDRLKAMPMQWMPADEVLPQSLQEWLQADYDPNKYTMAIKQQSKRMSSSLLDSMFTANQSTSEPIPDEQSRDENISTAETSEPALDLGVPVKVDAPVKPAKPNSKRKRSTSDTQPAPPQKKLREEAVHTPKDSSMGDAETGLSFSYMWKRGNYHAQPHQASNVEQIEELLKRVHAEEARFGLPRTPDVDRFELMNKTKLKRGKLKQKLTKKLERLIKMAGRKGERNMPNTEVKKVPTATSDTSESNTTKDRKKDDGVEKNSPDSHAFLQAMEETPLSRFPNTTRNFDGYITEKTKAQWATTDVRTGETRLPRTVKNLGQDNSIMKTTKKTLTVGKKMKNASFAAQLIKTRRQKLVSKIGKERNVPKRIKKKIKNSQQMESTVSSVINKNRTGVGLSYKKKKNNTSEDELVNSSMVHYIDDVVGYSLMEEQPTVKMNRSWQHKVKTSMSVVEDTSHEKQHKHITKQKDKVRKSKTTLNGKPETKLQAKFSRFSERTTSKWKKTRLKSALVCELGEMLTSGPSNVISDSACDIDGIFACLE